MSPRPLKSQDGSFADCVELARSGRHREAIDALLQSLPGTSLHPQRRAAAADALARISLLAEQAGDLERAEHAMLEAMRLCPRFADLQHRLGCLRLSAGKPAEARRSFEEALRINPRYVAARVELALLDAREGRLAEAMTTLRGLSQESPLERPQVFARGLESLEHADWERGGALVREALNLAEPGIQETIRDFRRRMEAGDLAGAAHAMRQAVRAHEGYADLHYLLGTAELEEGHLDDAVSSLARALELHPDFHGARIQLARALEALGDVAQAEEQVSFVLQADPRNPSALELSERWRRLHRRRMGGARKAS